MTQKAVHLDLTLFCLFFFFVCFFLNQKSTIILRQTITTLQMKQWRGSLRYRKNTRVLKQDCGVFIVTHNKIKTFLRCITVWNFCCMYSSLQTKHWSSGKMFGRVKRWTQQVRLVGVSVSKCLEGPGFHVERKSREPLWRCNSRAGLSTTAPWSHRGNTSETHTCRGKSGAQPPCEANVLQVSLDLGLIFYFFYIFWGLNE